MISLVIDECAELLIEINERWCESVPRFVCVVMYQKKNSPLGFVLSVFLKHLLASFCRLDPTGITIWHGTSRSSLKALTDRVWEHLVRGLGFRRRLRTIQDTIADQRSRRSQETQTQCLRRPR
jgi:hypothetical protein